MPNTTHSQDAHRMNGGSGLTTSSRSSSSSSDGGCNVSLEQHIIGILNERRSALVERFVSIDQDLTNQRDAVKLARDAASDAINAAMTSVKEATLKDEAAAKERLDSLDKKLGAAVVTLHNKLDTAVGQLQMAKGRESSFHLMWGIMAAIAALLISASGVVIAVLNRQ